MKPIIKIMSATSDPCQIENELANILKINGKHLEIQELVMAGMKTICIGATDGHFGTCKLVQMLEKPFLAPDGNTVLGAATSLKLYMHSDSMQDIIESNSGMWQLAGEIIIPNILTTLLSEHKNRKPSFENTEDDDFN